MPRKNINKLVGEHRSFLNKPGLVSLTSCISYTVQLSSYNEDLIKENLCNNCNIDFAISDCRRNINLEFDVYKEETYENSLYKLDTIIKACQLMKKDLSKARKELVKGLKKEEEIDSIETEEEKFNNRRNESLTRLEDL